MKKLLLIMASIIMPVITFAYDAVVDGIYYNLVETAQVAEVTYYSTNSITNSSVFSGDIIIPEEIEYNGVKYNVTSIGEKAFYGCGLISTVEIANTVKTIGEQAFCHCKSLQSVNFPNSIMLIDNMAFFNCISLESIEIPGSVKSMGTSCFAGCSSLKTVQLQNGIKSIDNGTFRDCSSLRSVEIPNSVTNLGPGVFAGCKSLIRVVLPNTLSIVGVSLFEGCENLASIDIPITVTSIYQSAFSNCKSLTNITFPENVSSIHDNACSDCISLKSIVLPKNITSISNKAFSNCINLLDVFCSADKVNNCSISAFDGTYIDDATLYVPQSAINYYTTTKPWSGFGNIIAISEGEEQCEKPRIFYNNGTLSFECDTEGVQFVSEITDTDIKKSFEADLNLSVTYNISVYAVKANFKDSEIATATLCWIDVEPQTEGISSSLTSISARPILIQINDGNIIINGAEDGNIIIYDLSGQKVGEGKSVNGNANIKTSLQKNSVAMIKLKEKTIKVLVK